LFERLTVHYVGFAVFLLEVQSQQLDPWVPQEILVAERWRRLLAMTIPAAIGGLAEELQFQVRSNRSMGWGRVKRLGNHGLELWKTMGKSGISLLFAKHPCNLG